MISAKDAVDAYKAATLRHGQARYAEAGACGDAVYAAAKLETEAAIRGEQLARVQAQHAVKEATGFFPYELAVMGL